MKWSEYFQSATFDLNDECYWDGHCFFFEENRRVESHDEYIDQLLCGNAYFFYDNSHTQMVFFCDDYCYGFNGKEKDNEVAGSGNQYDYGFRIYNPRIAKFLSVDPLTSSFPYYTPYQFAGNKPIIAIDLDGLEEVIMIMGKKGTKPTVVKYGDENFETIKNSMLQYVSSPAQAEKWINGKGGYDALSTPTLYDGAKGPLHGLLVIDTSTDEISFAYVDMGWVDGDGDSEFLDNFADAYMRERNSGADLGPGMIATSPGLFDVLKDISKKMGKGGLDDIPIERGGNFPSINIFDEDVIARDFDKFPIGDTVNHDYIMDEPEHKTSNNALKITSDTSTVYVNPKNIKGGKTAKDFKEVRSSTLPK